MKFDVECTSTSNTMESHLIGEEEELSAPEVVFAAAFSTPGGWGPGRPTINVSMDNQPKSFGRLFEVGVDYEVEIRPKVKGIDNVDV